MHDDFRFKYKQEKVSKLMKMGIKNEWKTKVHISDTKLQLHPTKHGDDLS